MIIWIMDKDGKTEHFEDTQKYHELCYDLNKAIDVHLKSYDSLRNVKKKVGRALSKNSFKKLPI